MGDDAPLVAPGSIHMREIFDVKESDQFKFREYAWSMGDDVNATLEDNAVEVTCKAMGWEVPTNWREVRTKQSMPDVQVYQLPFGIWLRILQVDPS